MRVGLYGGTFNPPHRGHEAAGLIAFAELGLDRLLVMPNHLPPHKRLRGDVCAYTRLELSRALCRPHAGWEAVDWEVSCSGMSYSLASLQRFACEFPADERWFILGTDSARSLPQWHDAPLLGALASFAVVGRTGERPISPDELANIERLLAPLHIRSLTDSGFDVSSTYVCERLAGGGELDGLLPDAVAEVVQARGLYRRS